MDRVVKQCIICAKADSECTCLCSKEDLDKERIRDLKKKQKSIMTAFPGLTTVSSVHAADFRATSVVSRPEKAKRSGSDSWVLFAEEGARRMIAEITSRWQE